MTPYQFALLRYRHSPTAGELVNIGVVMWLPSEHRLLHFVRGHYRRLSHFLQNFEGLSYRPMIRHLMSRLGEASREVAEAQEDLVRGRAHDLATILKRLVSDPDSCFQWSAIMAGMAKDQPEARLRQLVYEFVLRHEEAIDSVGRNEKQMWHTMEQTLKRRRLVMPGKLESGVKIVGGQEYSWTFRTGWHNETQQVLEPITFDYLKPSQVTEKATTWIGRLVSLSPELFQMTAVVARPQKTENRTAYERAVARLRRMPNVRAIIEEEEFDAFVAKIEEDLQPSGSGH